MQVGSAIDHLALLEAAVASFFITRRLIANSEKPLDRI